MNQEDIQDERHRHYQDASVQVKLQSADKGD